MPRRTADRRPRLAQIPPDVGRITVQGLRVMDPEVQAAIADVFAHFTATDSASPATVATATD